MPKCTIVRSSIKAWIRQTVSFAESSLTKMTI